MYYSVDQYGNWSKGIKTETHFVTKQAYKFCKLYAEIRKPHLVEKVEDIFKPWKPLMSDDSFANNGGYIVGRVAYYDTLKDLPLNQVFDENGVYIAPREWLDYKYYFNPY